MSVAVSGLKLTTDHEISRVEIPTDGGSMSLEALYRVVECRVVDVVSLDLDGVELSLWVDEEGFYKANPVVNVLGMHLVKTLNGALYQPYVGAMVITGFDPDTGAAVSLTEEQMQRVEQLVADFDFTRDLAPLVAPFDDLVSFA